MTRFDTQPVDGHAPALAAVTQFADLGDASGEVGCPLRARRLSRDRPCGRRFAAGVDPNVACTASNDMSSMTCQVLPSSEASVSPLHDFFRGW